MSGAIHRLDEFACVESSHVLVLDLDDQAKVPARVPLPGLERAEDIELEPLLLVALHHLGVEHDMLLDPALVLDPLDPGDGDPDLVLQTLLGTQNGLGVVLRGL